MRFRVDQRVMRNLDRERGKSSPAPPRGDSEELELRKSLDPQFRDHLEEGLLIF